MLVLAGVATATVGGLAALRTDTSPASFLPAGDPSLRLLRETAQSFGSDPIVVLIESAQPRQLVNGDQLPRLLALEGKLAGLPDVAVVYGPASILNQIAINSQDLLAELAGRRDRIRAEAETRVRQAGGGEAAAASAGQAAVDQFDMRYGALLVRGLPAGLPTLHNPGFVNAVAFEPNGEPKAQWRFVLPSANAASILVRPRENLDQAGTERLVEAVRQATGQSGLKSTRVTISGSPAVAAGLGARARGEIPLLGGVATALIALCYLLTPWLHRKKQRLVPLGITFCATAVVLAAFGWLRVPLSLGVVTFLPILLGIGSDFPAYLVQGGAHIKRILVTALASAAGLGSLALSPLPFVRDLGIALASGVLLAVATALLVRRSLSLSTLLPAVPDEVSANEASAITRPRPNNRLTAAALAVAGTIAAVGWALLPHLSLSASPEQLAAGLPALADAEYTERALGSSGEVDVVLSGPDVTTPEALGWMRRAEDGVVIAHGNQLRPIVSLPDLFRFLGGSPSKGQIDAAMRLIPGYLTRAVVGSDHTQALLSFGLKLQDLDAQRHLLDELRATLPPAPDGFKAEVTGLPVVAARGYRLIAGDRYLTNGGGILAAGLVLLIGLRRRSDALRAVLAAALATGWGLAAVGGLGMSLTPLTVALGSLTTATACEFTSLLSAGQGTSRTRVRRTVAVAALAAALGYASLAMSGLAMIREFGLLLAASVGLSFVAARLVTWLLPVTDAGKRSSSSSQAAALKGPVVREVKL